MRTDWRMRAGAVALVLAVVMAAPVRAEEAASEGGDEASAVGTSYTVEATASFHQVDHPYFGTGERRNGWGEGFSRVRLNQGFANGLTFTVGGVGMRTVGKDYYGTTDVGDGRLDQLVVRMDDVGKSGFGFSLGRQDIVLGTGFLVGDGYVDRRAALWNIPLNFYDGLLVTYRQKDVHALAFGVNLSHSIGSDGAYPKGQIFGGEFGWGKADGRDVSVAVVKANDTEDTDLNPIAYSLRVTWPDGPVQLSGEYVLEGGTIGGTDLSGNGGHIRFDVPVKAKWSPVATAEYYYLSGPGTDPGKDKAYFPWQFRWNDWSQYYVGDFLASTVTTSSNLQVLIARLAVTPREGTTLRLLAHDFTRNQEIIAVNKHYASEFDLVIDQSIGEHLNAWIMGGVAAPYDAAKAESGGSATGGQFFASLTYKFGGKLGK